MRTAALVRANAYIDEADRSRVLALREDPRHFAFDHFVRRCQNGFPRIENDQPSSRQFRQVQPGRLSHQPFHAIADDGLAERPGDGKADTRPLVTRAPQTKSGKALGRNAGTLVIDAAELGRPQDPGGLWKAEAAAWVDVRLAWRSGQRVRR